MSKICVKSATDGTHSVVQGHEPLASGLSLEEAENFSTFMRASARLARTRRLHDALRLRG
ncbi:hypothetical protein Q8W71_16305 [Methylobacterium sp. NEAU 140]|uniref:hypothetical protein n=1 Tax=Methylobacterium sp. NEAU 140 TaxID=3064945 RepID=UPI0027345051|nr:hypothetical protein [Methylobacterium sp. NEAU 140]MDP4024192.1 hypothetical protein [Methylobacterium sp. NEAU 140]